MPDDIYLIVLDSLREDKAPPNTDLMPHLSEFSKESIRFSRALATSSWSVPSHASIFTGKYPSQHNSTARNKLLQPGTETLAEIGQSNGYRTLCVTANPWITPEFEFTRGFEEIIDLRPDLPLSDVPDPRDEIDSDGIWGEAIQTSRWCLNGNPAKRAAKAAYLKFLHERSHPDADKVFETILTEGSKTSSQFVFANVMDAHEPYFSGADQSRTAWNLNSVAQDQQLDSSRIRAAYEKSVKSVDRSLGEFITRLQNHDRFNNSWIIITSDHGQALGESGYWGHGTFLHDCLIEVPLYIRPPGGVSDPTVIDKPFSLRKLFNVTSDIMGSDRALLTGNIQEEIQRRYTEELVVAESAGPHMDEEIPEGSVNAGGYRGYYGHDWQMIEEIGVATEPDPALNESQMELIRDIKADKNLRTDWEASDGVDMSAETKNRLSDLGYI